MFARSVRTPSYRHHKPSGQAVVTFNGRDIYLGPYGTPKSRSEYDRIIAEWLASGRQVPGVSDITTNELSLRYLNFVDGYYTSNEPANIRHALKPLRKLYGLEVATEFGPLKLKAVRLEFLAAGHCRNEINKRVRRTVRMFKWAVGEELVPPSVHHGLRAVEGLRKGRGGVRESKPVKPVPDAFVDAIRPFVSRQVCAMIELQRLTGMRPGEVCIMRTGDVNTTDRIWEYVPMEHKTEHLGRHRTILLGPRAQEVLRPWQRKNIEEYLFRPSEAEAEQRGAMRLARRSRIQPSQQDRRKARPRKRPGERYDADSYRRAITAACDRAFPHPTLGSIPKKELTDDQRAELKSWRKGHRWHPHQLRHNAATRLRREFGLDVAPGRTGT